MDLGHYRQEYETAGLDVGDVDADPIVQFERWFRDTERAELYEPNAMTVATVTEAGTPEARIVLLKTFDTRGFVFFTNYESDKGMQLAANPGIALTFGWVELHRQVRIVGVAEHVSAEESDAYFNSRPRGSRLGAWASPQSQAVANRGVLDDLWREVDERHPEEAGDIPRPLHWGGIRAVPMTVEFWQGRPNRMHDRLVYSRESASATTWQIERLAP